MKTKKSVYSYSFGDYKSTKKDFLIPYPDNAVDGFFLGLTSGKQQKYGLVVMTGRDLSKDDLMGKLIQSGRKIIDVTYTLELLNHYLILLKEFKIGNVIEVKYNSSLPYGFGLYLVSKSLPNKSPKRIP